MKIVIKQSRIIRWKAPSNSDIDLCIAFQESIAIATLVGSYNSFIPRVGEYIELGGTRYKVERVVYKYKNDYSFLCNEIEIQVSSHITVVDYYNYMKAFTHEYDFYKYGKDITKVIDCKDYKTNLPNSYEEWMRDIKDLKNISHASDDKLLEMVSRRSVRKEKKYE